MDLKFIYMIVSGYLESVKKDSESSRWGSVIEF